MSFLPSTSTDIAHNSRSAISTIEERKMQQCLDTLLQALNKLKDRLTDLLHKLSLNDPNADWPRYLSSFALCAAELVEVKKALQSDRTATLGTVCALPVLLNRDEDPNLSRQTERRLPCFNHEIAPHYLRTKLAPEVEIRRQELSTRSAALGVVTAETLQKVNLPTQMLDKMLNEIRKELDVSTSSANIAAANVISHMSNQEAGEATKKLLQFMNGTSKGIVAGSHK